MIINGVSLVIGVMSGTALSVAAVDGDPDVWLRSLRLLDWTRHMSIGDSILAAEWAFAATYACLLAIVGSLVWMGIARIGRDSASAASLLGLLVAFGGALSVFDPMAEIATCLLVSGAGMIAALVTFHLHHALSSMFDR
ncbi:hypothetical protein [Sphingomonas crocodyli]|uniref:Uncharacterized protein n=1 Tax=Sphingomonas crocodyli TaxID=1979270 RepID=A0A437M418_9SPHN|nr:hypothetical protein [Sphingomonas crocodyli]RVT92441.1 hypothetical protein EOD43_00455 [Sphingomonas crocodyli]